MRPVRQNPWGAAYGAANRSMGLLQRSARWHASGGKICRPPRGCANRVLNGLTWSGRWPAAYATTHQVVLPMGARMAWRAKRNGPGAAPGLRRRGRRWNSKNMEPRTARWAASNNLGRGVRPVLSGISVELLVGPRNLRTLIRNGRGGGARPHRVGRVAHGAANCAMGALD